MMYGSWDIKCKGQSFLSFEPPNNQKNQNFEKIKMPGEIIILHLCTTNDNHMMNGSWDTDRIFHHFGLFLPFYPTNNPENQNVENMKKNSWRYIILQKCTINDNHMIHGSGDMKCNRQNFFVILGHFLPFYPANSPKNKNFKKLKKKAWRYHHSTQVYQKS